MDDSNVLLLNINKLHTTKMGIGRIRKNLNLSEIDVVKYCKDKILKKLAKYIKKAKIGTVKLIISCLLLILIVLQLSQHIK